MTTDHLTLLQAIGGPRNRFITQVEVSLDGREPFTVELGDESHTEDPASDGQRVDFDEQTFSTMDIKVTETDPGKLRRYDGISSVGFAEVGVVDESGDRPVADDISGKTDPGPMLTMTGRAGCSQRTTVGPNEPQTDNATV